MAVAIRMTFVSIGVIVFAVAVAACSKRATDDGQGEETMPARPIEAVLAEHTDELMSVPGVVGTAQGLCNDKPCIKVFVMKKTPELDQKIPSVLEGYTVDVEETGAFRALPG